MKKSKSNRQKLVNKIYTLVCKIVHARGACELCRKTSGKLDLHHIQGRVGILKYWLPNCILLCFNCHSRGVHNEAPAIQHKYRQQIISKRGNIDDLILLKSQKHSIIDLEQLYNAYLLLIKNDV